MTEITARLANRPTIKDRRDAASKGTARRSAVRGAAMIVIGITAVSAESNAQGRTVGSINLYGVRSVSEDTVRAVVGVRKGDPQPSPFQTAAIERRLAGLPAVLGAELSVVCCEDGHVNVFVGIAEDSAAILRFRAPPSSQVRLPADVVTAGSDFEQALVRAVQSGNNRDDLSEGHSLMADSAARAVQERFITFAERDLSVLRDVLRHSSNADDRALAAMIVGYAPDKHTVVDDLLYAAWDGDDGVRNNATRALTAIALFGNNRPELGIRISPEPFIEMLESLSWTDRNKGSALLTVLTKPRDHRLLRQLREEAMDALIEMANWQAIHAGFAFVILGRMAGIAEEKLLEARPNREARGRLLAEALESLGLSSRD